MDLAIQFRTLLHGLKCKYIIYLFNKYSTITIRIDSQLPQIKLSQHTKSMEFRLQIYIFRGGVLMGEHNFVMRYFR